MINKKEWLERIDYNLYRRSGVRLSKKGYLKSVCVVPKGGGKKEKFLIIFSAIHKISGKIVIGIVKYCMG
jgi:hypothetical protein